MLAVVRCLLCVQQQQVKLGNRCVNPSQSLCCPRNGKQVRVCHNATEGYPREGDRSNLASPETGLLTHAWKYRGVTVIQTTGSSNSNYLRFYKRFSQRRLTSGISLFKSFACGVACLIREYNNEKHTHAAPARADSDVSDFVITGR